MDDHQKQIVTDVVLSLRSRINQMLHKTRISGITTDELIHNVLIKLYTSYRGNFSAKHIEACTMNACRWHLTDSVRVGSRRRELKGELVATNMYPDTTTVDYDLHAELHYQLEKYLPDEHIAIVYDFYFSGMGEAELTAKYGRTYRSLQRKVANLIKQIKEGVSTGV